jgi:hypothetical protein
MIQAIIPSIVSAIVGGLIQNPQVPVDSRNATVVANQIEQTINKQVGPVLTNATNNEPWYRSRVTVGNLVGIAASVGSMFGFAVAPEDQDVIVGVVTGGVATLGALFSLYGRWKARYSPPMGA